MLQGNGVMGVMIWGEGSVLRLTIGRADFWDHRGGIRWNEQMSFATIRACLESGDEQRLREIFARADKQPGEPDWPSVLPIGRIELDFGAGVTLTAGTLHLDDGMASVRLQQGTLTGYVRIALAMDAPVLAVEYPEALPAPAIRCVTAWEAVGDYLQSIAFAPRE